jgi:hypothetical protein
MVLSVFKNHATLILIVRKIILIARTISVGQKLALWMSFKNVHLPITAIQELRFVTFVINLTINAQQV